MSQKIKSTEDIIAIVNHVSYKKTEGKLYLMAERMAWMTNSSDSFKISETYVNIKNQRISADDKDKVQIQLIMYSGSSFTFQFTNPNGRKQQLVERDEIKNKLGNLLPRFRIRAQKELEVKRDICEKNPTILFLYRELVGNRYLCIEDFWGRILESSSRRFHNDFPTLKLGIPSILLVNLSQSNRQVYCSDEMIGDIFKVYPSVKQCFKENGETVKDFWNRFFQSHYYHLFKLYQTKDMFGECEEKDIKAVKENANELRNLPVYQNPFEERGEFINQFSCNSDNENKTYTASQQLMRRVNRQSVLIMKTMTTEKRVFNDPTDLDAPNKKPKLSNENITKNDEMQVFTGEIFQKDFVTNNPERIKNYLTKMNFNKNNKSNNKVLPKTGRVDRICRYVPPKFSRNENQQTNTVDVLTEIGHLFSDADPVNLISGLANRTTDNVLKEIINDLKRLYQTACELFCHFWECFPVCNAEKFAKLHRVYEAIKKFKIEKIDGFIADHPNHYLITGSMDNKAIDHLCRMFEKINQAFVRYMKNYNKNM